MKLDTLKGSDVTDRIETIHSALLVNDMSAPASRIRRVLSQPSGILSSTLRILENRSEYLEQTEFQSEMGVIILYFVSDLFQLRLAARVALSCSSHNLRKATLSFKIRTHFRIPYFHHTSAVSRLLLAAIMLLFTAYVTDPFGFFMKPEHLSSLDVGGKNSPIEKNDVSLILLWFLQLEI